MEILYADNHLVVVNKPSGIPTESKEEPDLEALVAAWIKEKYEKKGAVFVKAVHRLDKPASGIVLLAKTSKALTRLHESFQKREVEKTYLAVVEGAVEEEGIFEDCLLREEYISRVTNPGNALGKEASLSYKLQRKIKGNSLVEVDLHTGRYHQIRVQFSSRGHPVLNDVKYGAKRLSGEKRIALHHTKLQFPHPVSKEILTFTHTPPESFYNF